MIRQQSPSLPRAKSDFAVDFEVSHLTFRILPRIRPTLIGEIREPFSGQLGQTGNHKPHRNRKPLREVVQAEEEGRQRARAGVETES